MTKEAAQPDIKFGTDGWRGIIARDFTFANVRRAAQAVADYVKSAPQVPGPGGKNVAIKPDTKVVVGYDNRFQSDQFALAAARQLQAAGLKATLLEEPLPTPAVSWLTAKSEYKLGVVITASHNPPSWNGFKIKFGGRAAPEVVTLGVEGLLGKTAPAADGDVARKSFKDGYVGFLKSLYDTSAISKKLTKPVVVDYMYGSGCGLLSEVLKYKKIVPIRDRRDPLFGGVHPEPIEKYLDALKKAVLANKAAIGVALDGDADRFGLVDDKGNYITPCQVFPLIMEYLIETKKLKGKVVQSVSLGYLPKRIARAHNMPFEEVPVGFKYIAEKMLTEDVAFGGEESGGYSWKGMLPERDGLASALLFLEMIGRTKKTPSQLIAAMEKKYGKSFYTRRDIKLSRPADRKGFMDRVVKHLPATLGGSKIVEKLTIDGVKIFLENDEWLLMRPSGTEPLIRAYVETGDPKKTNAILDIAEKTIQEVLAAEPVKAVKAKGKAKPKMLEKPKKK